MLRALFLTPFLLVPTLLATPAMAATKVLDFSGNICGGSCSLGEAIDQDYGSMPGLKVTWRSLDGAGDATEVTPFVQAARKSGDPIDLPPYGDNPAQTGAFAPFESLVGEVRFELTGVGSITLMSIETVVFDRFQGYSSSFRIYDLDYGLLFDSGQVDLPEFDFATIDLMGVSSTSGLILQWGAPNQSGFETFGSDQGIDTLVFDLDVVAPPPPPAVPEPATWAMLVLGFGVVGAAARRRRREVSAA